MCLAHLNKKCLPFGLYLVYIFIYSAYQNISLVPSRRTFTNVINFYDCNTSNMMDIHDTYMNGIQNSIKYSYLLDFHNIHIWWISTYMTYHYPLGSIRPFLIPFSNSTFVKSLTALIREATKKNWQNLGKSLFRVSSYVLDISISTVVGFFVEFQGPWSGKK